MTTKIKSVKAAKALPYRLTLRGKIIASFATSGELEKAYDDFYNTRADVGTLTKEFPAERGGKSVQVASVLSCAADTLDAFQCEDADYYRAEFAKIEKSIPRYARDGVTLIKLACGCKVQKGAYDDSPHELLFCATHKAAPDLLAACEIALAALDGAHDKLRGMGLVPNPQPDPVRDTLRGAIAPANP